MAVAVGAVRVVRVVGGRVVSGKVLQPCAIGAMGVDIVFRDPGPIEHSVLKDGAKSKRERITRFRV